jgi:choline/glycine/proline betaine transport protein
MQKSKKWFDFYLPVTIPAVIIVLAFVSLTLMFGNDTQSLFEQIRDYLYDNVGWFFVAVVNIMLVATIGIAFSPFGKIRLGGALAKPDFSKFAWYSMLFSAGMGIGLIFYGVAEPLQHFATPPIPVGSEAKAAEQAFKFTLLHYGFHPWAIYGIVALAFAFFTFNKNYHLR